MSPFPTARARRALAAAAIAGSLAFTLAACGTEQSGSSGSQTQAATATDEFPVTVEHAFGKTTVEQNPQRVATVGWANHEVPLALGIVPVGMSKATWGDDDGNGIMPWNEEKLSELGGEAPVLFDETDGIPFEEVANTKPDVILASYSGLTKEDYETLSKIAPVVAYPDIPWGTSMKDMTEMNAAALGRKADGEKLVQDAERRLPTLSTSIQT